MKKYKHRVQNYSKLHRVRIIMFPAPFFTLRLVILDYSQVNAQKEATAASKRVTQLEKQAAEVSQWDHAGVPFKYFLRPDFNPPA